MNLLLYLLERQKALKSSDVHRANSLQWRINLAVRAVLAKVIVQVPAGTELSKQLNEIRESFDTGHKKETQVMTKKPTKKAATAAQPKVEKVARGERVDGVKFDVDKAVRLYKDGKTISDIAQAMGYPKGKGNNRTHAALVNAGVRKARPAEK